MLNDKLILISCKLESGRVPLTPDEQILLENWLREHPSWDKKEVTEEELLEMGRYHRKTATVLKEFMEEHFPEQVGPPAAEIPVVEMPVDLGNFSKRRFNWRRFITAAAILLLVAGIGYWAVYVFNLNRYEIPVSDLKMEQMPDNVNTYLVLADGSKLALNKIKKDSLIIQDQTRIHKLSDRSFQYIPVIADQKDSVRFNTLQVPMGLPYQLILPDGSKVWLNALSSLRYPVAFNDSMRSVELTGEAYFEVKKLPYKGFSVTTKGMYVKVLGTHFNIQAYGDGSTVKTTLLDGEVEVYVQDKKETLRIPGQQAQVEGSRLRKVGDINLKETTAWKDEEFYYKDAPLEVIMRDVARCYNVEVIYEGDIGPERFRIEGFSRSEPVTNLLNALTKMSSSSLNYKLERRKITLYNDK